VFVSIHLRWNTTDRESCVSELRTGIDENIQISFRQLPEPKTDTYFEVIKHWLALCDNPTKHPACRHIPLHPEAVPSRKELPTRLIEVGAPGDPKVYLRTTKPGDTGTWMALSHRWGPKPHFCTTPANLASYLADGIDFAALPPTFRDAVTVTRAVGGRCRYLWIDSLCIVQGEGGDFNDEAKRMPQVYSGAYCVLAASRAANHYAGFLHPRKGGERAVTLRQHGGSGHPFYIRENVDDFGGHVLEGELNSRGWVLQEHALARRTVFFTDYQTYFECGEGVRCETMMTMRKYVPPNFPHPLQVPFPHTHSHLSDLAALLGDPNFPHIIQRADRGEMILRYQDLYKRYSRLGLSEDFDRPMAIDGLQRRILDALRTKGGFGVFDQDDRKGLLHRSLLWHRDVTTADSPLRRIVFPSNWAISAVPSWSWMAYTGAIDYVSPPFNGVAWEKLRSPWSGDGVEGVKTETKVRRMALVGEARGYNPFKGGNAAGRDDQDSGLLVFDVPGQSEQPETLCVVLGIQRHVPQDEANCYLLLVKEAAGREDHKGQKVHERAGTGYLPGRCLDWSRSTRVIIH